MTITTPKFFENLHVAISSITGQPRIILSKKTINPFSVNFLYKPITRLKSEEL